jgi:hypothetical protein
MTLKLPASRAVRGPAMSKHDVEDDLGCWPQRGCLKPWSRPSPTSAGLVCTWSCGLLLARPAEPGTERGGDRSGVPGGEPGSARRAAASRLELVEKVVTQSLLSWVGMEQAPAAVGLDGDRGL